MLLGYHQYLLLFLITVEFNRVLLFGPEELFNSRKMCEKIDVYNKSKKYVIMMMFQFSM